MTMIETEGRGIVLRKEFAWTLLVAIIGAGFWAGSTITGLQSSFSAMAQQLQASTSETRAMVATDRAATAALEARVRALETAGSRQDARFDALARALDEVKEQQREANELLRQIVAPARR